MHSTKKLLHIFRWIFEITLRFFYFLLAVIILGLAIFVLGGYPFLNGLWGTDFASAISVAVWVDKYFPSVPFWYPLSGGGISLTHAYPMLAFYMAAFLNSISSLNIFQSFTLLGFLSVVSMTFSIYAFVALRFKSQTAALIASIFYLVSPISWTWLVDWGFYAESVSHIFVGPAIVFWDLYFTKAIKNDWGFKTRIYLLSTVLFVMLGMGAHFLEGFTLIRLFSFYVIGYTIISAGARIRTLVYGFSAFALIAVFVFLASLPFTVPYTTYSGIAGESGVGGWSLEQLQLQLPKAPFILGFSHYKPTDFLYSMRYFSFPWFISILAIISILISFWRNKKILIFGLYSLYAFTLALWPDFWWVQRDNSIFSFLFTSGTNYREMFIVIRFIWPILAALAIVELFNLLLFWIKNKHLLLLKKSIVPVASLILAGYVLNIFPYFFPGYNTHQEISYINDIYNKNKTTSITQYPYGARASLDVRNIFKKPKIQTILNSDGCTNPIFGITSEEIATRSKLYGGVNGLMRLCTTPLQKYFIATSFMNECSELQHKGEAVPEICSIHSLSEENVRSFWKGCQDGVNSQALCHWRVLSVQEQLELKNWTPFSMVENYNPTPDFNNTLEKITQQNRDARMDFSPQASNYSMYAPFYNLNRSLSQMHTYITSASLMLRFQGWQQTAFYQNMPQINTTELIDNLAKWFGINYAILGGNPNGAVFEKAGWGKYGDGIFKFENDNSLLELSNKPVFLALGQKKLQAYDQVFSISALGALPYDDAYVVWGSNSVDDYVLDELKKFHSIILHGYTYNNKVKADRLLTQYVEGGGNVFIDTGWQYTVPDWQSKNATDKTLEIIPFNHLSWKNLGKSSNYLIEDDSFFGTIDISKFKPLAYGDQPWSVSTSDKSDLKSWAKVVLSVDDYPLVVTGGLGSGKIVWSGMNLFVHAKPDMNVYQEEIGLLSNFFKWFKQGSNSRSDFKVNFERITPDKTEFIIDEEVNGRTFLLWKEAYYPYFDASYVSAASGNQKLSTYKAGPGFTLIEVPNAKLGDKIIYEYKKPFLEQISPIISLVAYLCILLFILEALIMRRHSFVYKVGHIISSRFKSGFVHKVTRQIKNINKEEEDY